MHSPPHPTHITTHTHTRLLGLRRGRLLILQQVAEVHVQERGRRLRLRRLRGQRRPRMRRRVFLLVRVCKGLRPVAAISFAALVAAWSRVGWRQPILRRLIM